MRSLLTTDTDHCYYCGKPRKMMHTVFALTEQHDRASREDGMFIPVCWDCNLKLHLSQQMQHRLYIEGQIAWERTYPMLVFEKRYGRSFL